MTLNLYRLGQPVPTDGWLMSDWGAGQSSITAWSPTMIRTAADGVIEMLLDGNTTGTGRAVLGSEIQSSAVATTGTFSWTAQAPKMTAGAVFGLFTYKADYIKQPWLEFDFEWVGADTSKVQLTVHMTDGTGRHISNLEKTVIDLGFDAAQGAHTYDMTLTGTGAVFRADGRVIAYFSDADMPGQVWTTGALKGFADLWAGDSRLTNWTGAWTDPIEPLVGRILDASVRPSDLGGAMPILGGTGADILGGTDGGDVLDGLAGNDILSGLAGDDRLMGGRGDDVLDLDAGNDWINGGDGQDWLRVSGPTGVTLDLSIHWTSQDTGRGRDSLRNIEHVSGSSGGDRLLGSAGVNSLMGQGGNDTIEGRGGADAITGGLGRDTMIGGWNDKARDVFIFNAVAESAAGSANRDIVQGFEAGIDDIDLRAIDANGMQAGDQAFLWGGTTAGAHRAWATTSWGTTILKADTTGDGVADLEVQLNGLPGLAVADLLL